MKENLIKLLTEAQSKAIDASAFENATYATQLAIEADFLIENGVTITRPEDLKCTASLNFEDKYKKMLQEREELMAKIDFLRSEKESLETEFIRLRAQMDVVYLIFGGK